MTIFLYFFLFTFLSAIPAESDHQQNARHVANNNFEETTISSSKKDNFDHLQRKFHLAEELKKLKAELHLLESSIGNIKHTNPVTQPDYRYRRKVTNSPVDFNPLNFRNAPKNVASKEDWNHISQLLEDGRGTHPTAHPYLGSGENDRVLVRPVPRDGRFQDGGELEKLKSPDKEVMNNIRDNNNAHNQFEYDRKRKVPDNHLFEATPNNFRQTPINNIPIEDEEYLAEEQQRYASFKKYYLENFVSDEELLRLWNNDHQTYFSVHSNMLQQFLEKQPSLLSGSNTGELAKAVSEESSLSISKEVYKDLASSRSKEIFAKLPRF